MVLHQQDHVIGTQLFGVSSSQGAVDLVHPLDPLIVAQPLQEVEENIPQHGGVVLRPVMVEGLQL